MLRHESLVQKAAVNLLAGKAEVQYNPDVTGPRHLIHAVQDAGFEAQLLRGDRYVSFHTACPRLTASIIESIQQVLCTNAVQGNAPMWHASPSYGNGRVASLHSK